MERSEAEELYIVLDTNVLISFFWGGKTILSILDKIADGLCIPVASMAMLNELHAVGEREKFRKKFTVAIFEEFYQTYMNECIVVHPKHKVIGSRDIKDNMFLECALECQADYLITGDDDLLCLKNFHGTEIVNPAAFVKRTSK